MSVFERDVEFFAISIVKVLPPIPTLLVMRIAPLSRTAISVLAAPISTMIVERCPSSVASMTLATALILGSAIIGVSPALRTAWRQVSTSVRGTADMMTVTLSLVEIDNFVVDVK